MRLIDADALLDIIDGTIKTAAKTKKTREDVARLGEHFHFGEMVSAAPTIEPPQGEWKNFNNYRPNQRISDYEERFFCDLCENDADKMYPFCPHCGAKTKGGEA